MTPPPKSAPRHLAFSPNGKFVYTIQEAASTVMAFSYDAEHGVLKEIQMISTLPANFTGKNLSTAELIFHPSGKFLYGSNRGHDSIGVFGIDRAKGTLTPRQWVPAKGGVPRFFCFDPRQRFLYIANQGGHSIVGYKVERDGKLSPTGIRVKVPSPACIVFSGAY